MAAFSPTADTSTSSEIEFMTIEESTNLFTYSKKQWMQNPMRNQEFETVSKCLNHVFDSLITRGLQHLQPNFDDTEPKDEQLRQIIKEHHKQCLQELCEKSWKVFRGTASFPQLDTFEETVLGLCDLNYTEIDEKYTKAAFLCGLFIDNYEWTLSCQPQNDCNEFDQVLQQRTILFKILYCFRTVEFTEEERTRLQQFINRIQLPLKPQTLKFLVLWLQLVRWSPPSAIKILTQDVASSDKLESWVHDVMSSSIRALPLVLNSGKLQTLQLDYLCRFWNLYPPTASSFQSVAVHTQNPTDEMYAAADVLHVLQADIVICLKSNKPIVYESSTPPENGAPPGTHNTRMDVLTSLILPNDLQTIFYKDICANGMRPGHNPHPISDLHSESDDFEHNPVGPISLVSSTGLSRWRNSDIMRDAVASCKQIDINYMLTLDDCLITDVWRSRARRVDL